MVVAALSHPLEGVALRGVALQGVALRRRAWVYCERSELEPKASQKAGTADAGRWLCGVVNQA